MTKNIRRSQVKWKTMSTKDLANPQSEARKKVKNGERENSFRGVNGEIRGYPNIRHKHSKS